MSVGKIAPFDPLKDNWTIYIERLEQYFIVNEVKEDLKVPTLITVMGNDAYELLVNLCTPDKPSRKSFIQLVEIMKNHLQPRPSILAERYKFRQRKQARNEGIAEYVTDLKKLSMTCNFGAWLSESLRDQFVCGLRSDSVRQRLFAEEDLKFDKALRLAVTMEAAEADAALVEGHSCHELGDGQGTAAVHRAGVTGERRDRRGEREAPSGRAKVTVTAARRAGRPSGSAGAARGASVQERTWRAPCAVCGGQHAASTCKFRLYVCRICNKEGHLKRMCPRFGQTLTNYCMKEEHPGEGSDCSDEVNNFSIDSQTLKKYNPYYLKIKVHNCELIMELDTGSTISCLSYNNYLKMFSDCQLLNSDLLITYYTGEHIRPVGKIKVLVSYKDKAKQLDLYIIKGAKTTLLGRQWLQELGIEIPMAGCYAIDGNRGEFDLKEFSSRYCEVFADGLGRFTGGTVSLRMRADARPVFMRARPLAYALREPVERALAALQRDGVITPVDTSDWATPIVPVVKKDGSIRICGDFKLTINKYLEVDRFPLPKVEDLLARLHGGERFSKIDLSQAYAQFVLDDASKAYTVITTHKGLFRYERLVYGLSSSPGIFQRKLESLFVDLPQVGVFLDDVIITGSNDNEHMLNLNRVFDRLQKYGLKVRTDKCTFFEKSVTYLGYVISKDGVHTCPEKLKAIKKVAIPTNVTELRAFIGLVMYYAKFVPNISTLLKPLYNLLQKDVKFNWDDECNNAFNSVKSKLMSSEVLIHYSPKLPLVLTTDASSVGVGAVISHLLPGPSPRRGSVERPVAYASRVLNKAERSYSQMEREALAIIYGVRKFHQYLFGRKFILRTDHKPLVTIFGEKTGIPVMAAGRMQRWAVLLSGYNYDVQYVPSDRNGADGLSRLPVNDKKVDPDDRGLEKTYLNFVQNFLPITKEDVSNSTKTDSELRTIVLYLQSGWPHSCEDENLKNYFAKRHELYLESGCIMWGYRMVIPRVLRETILKELHVGHLGVVKMKCVARSYVWWPGIDRDIERRCRECPTCTAEAPAPNRAAPAPWPYVTEPWSRLHVDFLGPINGKTFLVIIDSTSKWLEIFHMYRTTAAATIKVLRETFARFGIPKEIVSDNGPPFSSREYTEFMTRNGIKLTFSAVYHPSSNGAAENAVKLCKRVVKKAHRDNVDIDVALQSYLLAYRNVEQSTTGASPAMLLQRRSLRNRLDFLRGQGAVETRVQACQKKQVEYAGGTTRVFSEGDEVWYRDYGEGKKWEAGRVSSRLGTRNYLICRKSGPPIKRHIDQLKARQSFVSFPLPSPPTPSKAITDTPPEIIEEFSEPVALPRGGEPPTLETGFSPDAHNNHPTENRPRRARKIVHRYGLESN